MFRLLRGLASAAGILKSAQKKAAKAPPPEALRGYAMQSVPSTGVTQPAVYQVSSVGPERPATKKGYPFYIPLVW
jgi:hypothetical protein